jgi:hypothetical protein
LLDQLRASGSPALLKLLQGGNIAENPTQIHKLPLAERTLIINAFSHTLQTVFFVAVPFAVMAFVISWFLKEIPLRQKTGGMEGESSSSLAFDAPGELPAL